MNEKKFEMCLLRECSINDYYYYNTMKQKRQAPFISFYHITFFAVHKQDDDRHRDQDMSS